MTWPAESRARAAPLRLSQWRQCGDPFARNGAAATNANQGESRGRRARVGACRVSYRDLGILGWLSSRNDHVGDWPSSSEHDELMEFAVSRRRTGGLSP